MTKTFHPDLLQPGDMVRHYRVVRRLGTGGFAFVYLVENGGRPYSLKIAARPPGDEDEARADERAFREAVSLGHFRHPNLLTVLEMGRWPELEGGHFFFVTDYVPGSTFNAWRWKTQAPLRRLVEVLGDLALVVAELHERDVCHRDIKADNVLIREGDDKPFLIDFGAVFLPGAYKLTQELPPVTFHNMPPEFAAFLRGGEWEHGAQFPAHPSADLYALGALLYEALTDCHPFNPRLPPDKLLLAIEFLPPVEPVQLDSRVPLGLNDLVIRLLAKDPEQRPRSARVVHEELMRMLERDGDTEAWNAPYAFPSNPGGNASRAASSASGLHLEGGAGPAAAPEEPAPAASGSAGQKGGTGDAGRPRGSWRRVLVVLVLVLVLLGVGCGLIRAACVSALGAACSGAASHTLASSAPLEKGCDPLFLSMQTSPGGILAWLCAASAHLLACASAPVRPDMGGFLEQCPPEALATAKQLGFKSSYTDVVLLSVTLASRETEDPRMRTDASNIRTGPMEGWMFVADDRFYRVTGEAKVFPDRVYIHFDRIYPDQVYPMPGRFPAPLCAVAVSERDPKFGVFTHAARPLPGAEIDPARVDHSPDAAIIDSPRVDTYVQLPGRRFPR